ncbi:hypothetical protein KCV04_g9, partial [Aureobasidium melanogenum]
MSTCWRNPQGCKCQRSVEDCECRRGSEGCRCRRSIEHRSERLSSTLGRAPITSVDWLIETHVGIRRLNKVSTLRFWRNWLAKAHVGVIRSDWKGKGLLSGLDVAILGVDGSGAWKRFQC